jgi:hypothetical protein
MQVNKAPRGKLRGIFGNYFTFAASSGELTPNEIRKEIT